MNLKNAKVIGFFSLPSASLSEHNPSAYRAAMADAPAGAGSCAHCGTGILHHVVVRCDGVVAFIGTDCASQIGGEVSRCSRERLTSEQIAARDAKTSARIEALAAERAAWEAKAKARREARSIEFARVLSVLKMAGTEFHKSLAEQLMNGSLSSRQAHFVVPLMFPTGRRNKKNAEEWDNLEGSLTCE